MTTATVDMTGFERGLSGFIGQTGIAMPKVLKKECGELIKTLVRISPPASPDATKSRIVNQVYVTMGALNHDILPLHQKILGGSNYTTWYAWNDRYLYGVSPELDMTKAGLPELKRVFLASKSSKAGPGRQTYDFVHKRKHQKVAISQKVITTVKQRQRLIDYVWRHIGRLKSGWLVAVGENIVTISGDNMPPNWVTRHTVGARGTAVDGTSVKDFPSITISNYAAGVDNKKNNLNYLVRGALKIRIKAMAKNATMYMQGKKNLRDYA